jgi:cytochrome d ubiquinol oxidase subunit I
MYVAVFGTGVSYMLKLVAKGPDGDGQEDASRDDQERNRRPARPLSAAPDHIDPAIGGASSGQE